MNGGMLDRLGAIHEAMMAPLTAHLVTVIAARVGSGPAEAALRDACRVQQPAAVAPVITAQYLDAVTGPAPGFDFTAAVPAEIVGGIVIGTASEIITPQPASWRAR